MGFKAMHGHRRHSEHGTFLSWRLLGTEYGSDITFNIYKGTRRLNARPVKDSTTFTDTTRGTGTYSVRTAVHGREILSRDEAFVLDEGYAEIPLLPAPDYYVQHSWPGDLDGDGRYELVVSRLPYAAGKPSYLEAYTLTGRNLWRVDLGPASFTRPAAPRRTTRHRPRSAGTATWPGSATTTASPSK